MISDGTLDEQYLTWLYSQVGSIKNDRNPARSFWALVAQLHQTRFEWSTPNDDNRTEDGKDLREEFINETGAERDRRWLGQDCSMLEMLIALSRRVEFESNKDVYYWFWTMLENLGLRAYTDDNWDDEALMVVDQTVVAVIDRQYHPNGAGGLFPLRHPTRDQREVEIWYQMSSYLLENGYE